MTWKAYLQAKLRRKLRDPLYVSLMHAKIAFDLLKLGLDTCPVSRPTQHLTVVSHSATTLVDVSRTTVDFYSATTTRLKAV